jgi:uncharacterized protein (UPF0210 family)
MAVTSAAAVSVHMKDYKGILAVCSAHLDMATYSAATNAVKHSISEQHMIGEA